MQKRCPKCAQTVEISTVLPVDTLCPKCGALIPYAESASQKPTHGVRADKPAEAPKKPGSTGIRTSKSSPALPAVPKLEELGNDAPIEKRVRPAAAAKPRSGNPWLLLIAGLVLGLLLAGSCVGVGLLVFRGGDTEPQPQLTQSPPTRVVEPPTTPSPPTKPTPPPNPLPPPVSPENRGMKLPPLPDAAQIEPVELTDVKLAIDLGGPVSRMQLAGGGRFIAVHMPQQRRIALVELAKKSIVRTLSVDDDILFAAGMNHLFVYSNARKMLERFRLPSLERDRARQAAAPGVLTSFCAGSSSDGPLLLATDHGATFFDADDLVPLEAKFWAEGDQLPGGRWWTGADGRSFGNIAPTGTGALWRIDDGKLRRMNIKAARPEFVVVNDECSTVFTGAGMATLPKAGYAVNDVQISGSGRTRTALPASAGDGVVMVIYMPSSPLGPGLRPPGPMPRGGSSLPRGPGGFPPGGMPPLPPGPGNPTYVGDGAAIVVLGTTSSPTAMLFGVDLAPPATGEKPPIEERIHSIPAAKLLVTLAATRDKLWLYRTQSDATIAGNRSSLRFMAVAPSVATRGRAWTHFTPARGKAGSRLVYQLVGAPPEMSIDERGVIRWDVPRNFAGDAAEFSVIARDPDTNEVATRQMTVQVAGGVIMPKTPSASLLLSGLDEYDPPLPMVRSPVTSSIDVKLPEAVYEVVVGGGGRYLLLRSSAKPAVHVFDVSKALLVRSLTLPAAPTLLVAGGSHFFVIDPKSGAVQRYDFATLNMDSSPPIPTKLRASGFERVLAAMGSESPGPLYWAMPGNSKVVQIDPRTMKFAALPWPEAKIANLRSLAASPDGTTLCGIGYETEANPTVLTIKHGETMVESFTEARNLSSLDRPEYLVPSVDGKAIFSPETVWTRESHFRSSSFGTNAWAPAHEPDYFVGSARDFRDPKPGKSVSRRFYIGRMSSEAVNKGRYMFASGGFVTITDQRLSPPRTPLFHHATHYYPSIGLLVILSLDARRLILHHADPGTVLRSTRGAKFVFPQCRPPRFVKPGQALEIPVLARSSGSQTVLSLVDGPEGMTLANQKLTWKVPDAVAASEVRFSIRARDAITNRETTQRYEIIVLPKKPVR